jgi:hypothetical protein
LSLTVSGMNSEQDITTICEQVVVWFDTIVMYSVRELSYVEFVPDYHLSYKGISRGREIRGEAGSYHAVRTHQFQSLSKRQVYK